MVRIPKAKKKWSRRRVIGGGLGLIGGGIGIGLTHRWLGRRPRATKAKKERSMSIQPVARVMRPVEQHWVGDGFHVSTIFSPSQLDAQLTSPFILMDHAPPKNFPPSERRRGVGEHPHRGFETVTFAYEGEIEHRDSGGGGGRIGSGEVQWMTAASGVVHEEMHSQAFTRTGGLFEMVQLWVNLPAKLKMGKPRYQAIAREAMVHFSLGDANGRLIAGSFADAQGPAKTHTPISVFDLSFDGPGRSEFELQPGTTTLVFWMSGSARAQQGTELAARDLMVLDRDKPGRVFLEAKEKSRALVLNGAPLNEPVVAYGPFVMNTRAEIQQAIKDYQSGKMGRLDSDA